MPPNKKDHDDIKPEEIAPLFDEKIERKAELLVRIAVAAAPTCPKAQAADIDIESAAGRTADTGSNTPVARKLLDFLGHRSTYYCIAAIAQFCHLLVTPMECWSGFASGNMTVATGKFGIFIMTSVVPFVMICCLITTRHGSKDAPEPGNGNKAIISPLAGGHYTAANLCAFYNCVYLFHKSIQSGYTPLPLVSALVAGIACMIAARITRLAATSARGTALVHDPEHRVPAWHLATAQESLSFRPRADRRAQLAA